MTQPLESEPPAGLEGRPDLDTPPLIVVPRRSLRNRLGLLPPLLIIAVALPVLTYRLLSPDWAWNRSAWNHWRSAKAAAPLTAALAAVPKVQPEPPLETPEPPKLVAKTPEPAESKPTPVENLAETTEPASEPPSDAKKTNDSWDDIRREAERKQAEIARLETLKKQEAERLARESPDHVGPRGDLANRHREIEQFLDAQIAMQRRMMNEMLRRMPMGFDQDADEMFNQFAREFQQRRAPMPRRAAPNPRRRPQPERSKQFSRQQRPGEIKIRMRFSDEVFHL
ncbi:MAG: hypothetical protein ABI353_14570 [Isosphaeraceae bacterium]